MGIFNIQGRAGDAKIAEFEPFGGRPYIAGEPERTQQNLLAVVQGSYEAECDTSAEQKFEGPHTSVGRVLVRLAERYL